MEFFLFAILTSLEDLYEIGKDFSQTVFKRIRIFMSTASAIE